MKDLQRQAEANSAKSKKVLGAMSDEQMKAIYQDVTDAAKNYAVAHNLDLVLHYNDATTRQDYQSAVNIARRVQTVALMPLYATPGMDISEELVKILNEKAKKD